ncbi:MAG: sugar phosphate isomerase/epimerase family protein [Novosphingobium sp.]|nr:sugar phosphate isomerase/epimerase [Novosphingobium sp.]
MHPAISINTLSLAPADLAAQIDTVAGIGARAISPGIEQVEQTGAQEAARLIRDAGLEVATLTYRAFGFATPADVASARERLAHTIEVAATIGAQTVIMTTGGRGTLTWAQAVDAFAEAVAPCTVLAEQAGVRLGIEPTSHLYADASIVHRLADVTAVARKAGVSVIIDTFACWFDADIEQAIADAGPLLSLIQVSDYVYGDRGLPCRAVPGDGAIPFERIIPVIAATGFDGYFDLEIIGPRLQAEGQEQGLRRAANHIGKLLG